MADWFAKKTTYFIVYIAITKIVQLNFYEEFLSILPDDTKKKLSVMCETKKKNKIYHSNFYLNWEKIEYKTKGIILNALWKWPVVLGEMLRF